MVEAKSPKKTRDTRWDISYKPTGHVKKRELNTIMRLLDRGWVAVDIARRLRRDPRTVQKHIDKVMQDQYAAVLSTCLSKPHINVPSNYTPVPLELHGQDWRLNPIIWFHLSAPDLSEDAEVHWERDFPSLVRRLKGQSFWRHYLKLKSDAYALQQEYECAAQALSEEDQVTWENTQHDRNAHFLPSRVPDEPEPAWDEWEPCYDHGYADRVVRVFGHQIKGLTEKMCNLEDGLQRLSDDLR